MTHETLELTTAEPVPGEVILDADLRYAELIKHFGYPFGTSFTDQATIVQRAENTASRVAEHPIPVALPLYGTYVLFSADPVTQRRIELGEEKILTDEEGFVFAWGVVESYVKTAQLSPHQPSPVEEVAIKVKDRFNDFMESTPDADRRVKQDKRLHDLYALYAASELAQVGDREAAQKYLSEVQNPEVREWLTALLGLEMMREFTTVDEATSAENLAIHAAYAYENAKVPKEVPETKIASNIDWQAFNTLFNPISSGQHEPATSGDPRKGYASSGDNSARRSTEEQLGHRRGLFIPRVSYGSVVMPDKLADTTDMAWDYGDVRLILKEEIVEPQHTTFTLGDSLNGKILRENRIVSRDDAAKAATILQKFYERGLKPPIFDSVHSYIEAQIEGYSIKDVEAVVMKHVPRGEEGFYAVLQTAELAIQHGIPVTYVFDTEAMLRDFAKERFTGRDIEEIIKDLAGEVARVAPNVSIQVSPIQDDTNDA